MSHPLSSPAVYRPRRPQKTPLYRLISENLSWFEEVYDERFNERYGPLTIQARRTLQGFLECGILDCGFARVYCETCRHEYLLAFSCRLRGLCPSCGGKRVEIWSRFLIDEVLADVPHRQLVFVIPRHLRRIFMHDKSIMSLLCRSMKEAVFAFYRSGLDRASAKPGTICCIQRFGDRVNGHIHLHVLCTDGAFDDDGFHHLPLGSEDISYLQRLFARYLLDGLVEAKRLSALFRDNILSWRRSGFSVDGSVRLWAGDTRGLGRILRYIGRNPISNERVVYDADKGRVKILSAKKLGGIRPQVANYDALDFMALLTQQVPPKGAHLVRYYGWYSSRSRAGRFNNEVRAGDSDRSNSPGARARRRRWAELLKLVFEVDPLKCPRCGNQMKIISFILPTQQEVILSILDHINHDYVTPPSTGPPRWEVMRQSESYWQAHRDYLPRDESEDELTQTFPADEFGTIELDSE